jgi:hypothetical protein
MCLGQLALLVGQDQQARHLPCQAQQGLLAPKVLRDPQEPRDLQDPQVQLAQWVQQGHKVLLETQAQQGPQAV